MTLIKRFFTLIFLSTYAICMYSQQIVERSAKKRPSWIGQVKEGYLITSATAPTLEEAQRKCMSSVKIQMLESVAQNIEYSSEILVEQLTHNDEVQSNISFSQKGKTNVANLPYISGISLSNASEAYWEHIRDKETGESYYTYSLLYPFTNADYQKLKSDFDALDKAMVNVMQRIEENIHNVNSVDSIESDIDKLESVRDYFFDKNRKAKANLLIEQHKRLLYKLNIESKRIERCKYRCWLTLDGKTIECSSLPKCKSETAIKIKTVIDEGSFVITFSDEECVNDDDNYIDIVLKLKHNTLKHRLHF